MKPVKEWVSEVERVSCCEIMNCVQTQGHIDMVQRKKDEYVEVLNMSFLFEPDFFLQGTNMLKL